MLQEAHPITSLCSNKSEQRYGSFQRATKVKMSKREERYGNLSGAAIFHHAEPYGRAIPLYWVEGPRGAHDGGGGYRQCDLTSQGGIRIRAVPFSATLPHFAISPPPPPTRCAELNSAKVSSICPYPHQSIRPPAAAGWQGKTVGRNHGPIGRVQPHCHTRMIISKMAEGVGTRGKRGARGGLRGCASVSKPPVGEKAGKVASEA